MMYRPNAERVPVLKDLVEQEAVTRDGEFKAEDVAAIVGADKFRVAAYLEVLARQGALSQRRAVSADRMHIEVIYGPRVVG